MIDEAPEGPGGVAAVRGEFPADCGRFCSVNPRR